MTSKLRDVVRKIELKNRENLEMLFSPSKWSKRFDSSDLVIENHVKLITQETRKNDEKYYSRTDVPYGENDSERFDIYYKTDECDKPIFVYIHGGYWQALSKNNSGYCVEPLVENGYRVIVVDYDLCPKVSVGEIVEQIKRAIFHIVQYGSDTNASSITLCGHSAGAHLIAVSMFALSTSRIPNIKLIQSLVLISGVYDLTKLYRTEAANPDNILCLDKTSARLLSPIYYNLDMFRNYLEPVKFFILVAENDSPKFIEQSTMLHEKLFDCGYQSEFKSFDNCDHFDIVENLRSDEYEITQYLIENLLK